MKPQRAVLDPVARVRGFLEQYRIDAIIRVLLPESTRTSALAAQILGCTVAEIAKTIGFVDSWNEQVNPVLVVLSGARRVSLRRLVLQLDVSDANLRKMSAEEVKSHTGYSIGGVPPFPHYPNVHVSADTSLFRFAEVWTAAGSNNTVMKIKPEVLTSQLKMRIVDASE